MLPEIKTLADWLKARDDIAVVTHINPDGDALGSTLALTLALQQLGKRVVPVCQDPVPHTHEFLPGAKTVRTPEALPFVPRNIFCVDAGDTGRVGNAACLMEGAEGVACLDHHETNAGFGDVSVIDPDAAATGQLVFDLLDELGVAPNYDMAVCLYTAISTDSGNFAFSCTSAATMRAAARCLEAGIDIADLNLRLFRALRPQRTKLLGMALAGIEFFEDGKIALIRITNDMFARSGANTTDVERIVTYGIDTEGVEVAALLEERDSDTKVSLRSQGRVNVAQVAAHMNGGGHDRAAGATLHMPFKQAEQHVLKLLRSALAAAGRP